MFNSYTAGREPITVSLDRTLTPWGRTDHLFRIDPQFVSQIVTVSTPSHGGYHVPSGAERDRLQAAFPKLDPEKHWFEEDCEWAFVALCFTEFFPPQAIKAAEKMMDSLYDGARPIAA